MARNTQPQSQSKVGKRRASSQPASSNGRSKGKPHTGKSPAAAGGRSGSGAQKQNQRSNTRGRRSK